jgi:ubiquinone/menaquinone biosynthesis C-methylase UbiE
MDGWSVTAVEPDASDLVGTGAIRRLAQNGNLDITVVENRGERLRFAGASFDLIYARQALHHAKDLDLFCAEMCRC